MTLTFGSLFAGIGGIDLGFVRAGLECKWQVEIDPACQKVLAKHWPDVPRYGDITTIDFTKLESVDVIAGGFPCQPVSVAGRRRGQDDERWLWPEFQRAIAEIRPRFAVIENVRGLRTKGLRSVLEGLASLRYDAEWQIVSAASVGAPHLRERLFILAYPDNARPQRLWAECGLGESRSQVEAAWRDWWASEPELGRVDARAAHRVDRLKQLGNTVVPQVAEVVGRALAAVA